MLLLQAASSARDTAATCIARVYASRWQDRKPDSTVPRPVTPPLHGLVTPPPPRLVLILPGPICPHSDASIGPTHALVLVQPILP
jgi:hypothetical protein